MYGITAESSVFSTIYLKKTYLSETNILKRLMETSAKDNREIYNTTLSVAPASGCFIWEGPDRALGEKRKLGEESLSRIQSSESSRAWTHTGSCLAYCQSGPPCPSQLRCWILHLSWLDFTASMRDLLACSSSLWRPLWIVAFSSMVSTAKVWCKQPT